ncbi:alkane oxidation protein activator PraB [Pseudomonas sp. MWU16-30323]|jgi:hypothetical protein|uniref:alkane oxidation protein activator PraB n=1 Tax=Pseudomonas sp. MWU16-30323 TaxID=2878094 RepID=UPI001CFAFC10|nr:alkane oxidation protein activator PraB [Pseudomonas sp. MWU16-30323]
MKSLKTLVSLTALTVCMGAASMANAVSISPINTDFTAGGTISVKSPSSLQLPITCNATFTGHVDGSGVASITNVVVSGSSALCGYPNITGLPWTLTASAVAAPNNGNVTNVGYTITKTGIIPSTCGPNTITVSYDNSSHILSAANQSLTGSCTVVSLSVTPSPTLTIVP